MSKFFKKLGAVAFFAAPAMVMAATGVIGVAALVGTVVVAAWWVC